MDSDDLARLRAEMDQAREGMKELAGHLRVFYEALIGAGFSKREAFSLMTTWLVAMCRGAQEEA